MVSIKLSGHNYLRFLDPSKQNFEVVHLHFNRLVFGLRFSPAVLGSVINHHVSQYQASNPTVTQNLLNIDNLITSTPDIESDYKFYVECKKVMAAGGMNLRKQHSNSLELLEKNKLQFTISKPKMYSSFILM